MLFRITILSFLFLAIPLFTSFTNTNALLTEAVYKREAPPVEKKKAKKKKRKKKIKKRHQKLKLKKKLNKQLTLGIIFLCIGLSVLVVGILFWASIPLVSVPSVGSAPTTGCTSGCISYGAGLAVAIGVGFVATIQVIFYVMLAAVALCFIILGIIFLVMGIKKQKLSQHYNSSYNETSTTKRNTSEPTIGEYPTRHDIRTEGEVHYNLKGKDLDEFIKLKLLIQKKQETIYLLKQKRLKKPSSKLDAQIADLEEDIKFHESRITFIISRSK